MTHNLPLQLTTFIGREQEVDDLTRLLASARLITVTGPGGVGKTRLAIEAAHRERAGEVWFVELAPVLDEALVPSAIASTMGIAEVPGESLMETLIQSLQSRCLLLVLDNCEHLIGACAATAEKLLQHCPSLSVLATSREPLNVAGELVQRVPPLAPAEGAALFMDRAMAAEPGFRGVLDSAWIVEKICERLDGLPLAIELAAACIRVLSADEIASRLDQRFVLLASGSHTAPVRHQSLRAVVDWSYALLSPQQQQLFRQLSVFVGGCSLEAIESICAVDGAPEADAAVLSSLRGLVEKSLVHAEEQDGATRYRMLETLRQYSGQKLRETGEEPSLCNRHLDWFLTLAERGEKGIYGEDAKSWLRLLQREIENFRVALDRARGDPSQREAGLRLAAALAPFFWFNGHASEGWDWLHSMLESDLRNAGRVRALAASVFFCMRRSDPVAAAAFAEEALLLARELGDPSLLAVALSDYGRVQFQRANPSVAEPLLEEALALARELNGWPRVYRLLRYLGRVMEALDRPRPAMTYFEEALDLARKAGDHIDIAHMQQGVGSLLLDSGDPKAAREQLEESLALASAFPFLREMAAAMSHLAGVAVAEGEMARALRLAGATVTIPRDVQGGLQPSDMARLERRLKPAYASLDPAIAEAAWAEGAAMTPQEAVSYALRRNSAASNRSRLTEREREVAILLARGLTNRDLAARLIISESTAKHHVENILAKLGLRSRAQIADWALETGLVEAGTVEDRPR